MLLHCITSPFYQTYDIYYVQAPSECSLLTLSGTHFYWWGWGLVPVAEISSIFLTVVLLYYHEHGCNTWTKNNIPEIKEIVMFLFFFFFSCAAVAKLPPDQVNIPHFDNTFSFYYQPNNYLTNNYLLTLITLNPGPAEPGYQKPTDLDLHCLPLKVCKFISTIWRK